MRPIITIIIGFIPWLVFAQSFDYKPSGIGGEVHEYEQFTISYAELHEQPYWVAYELTKEELAKARKRRDYFAEDTSISTGSATKADYKYSGYDRGHLCRASYCKETLTGYKQSFLFSNLSPQMPKVNRSRGIWFRLEETEIKFAKALGSVYGVSGPVFKDNLGDIGPNKVTVPGYFYKAILSNDRQHAIAFLVKHKVTGSDVFEFAISIDQLEAFSGIDFFPALEDPVENRIEKELELNHWMRLAGREVVEETPPSDEEPPPSDKEKIKIATFNIQIFGVTKSGKPEVMDTLASIIRSYDIVAVQEIKDISGGTPNVFLNKINESGGDSYNMVVSPRSGLQPDDENSQEQYAYYYNTSTIQALDNGRLFDDSSQDLFQREPFLARFKTINGAFTFVLSTIHTKPTEAMNEIAALHNVIEWAKTIYPSEDDFITLGDFNASCSYATPEKLDELQIRGESYMWIVSDEADTNVSTSSSCAYDRIVITTGGISDYANSWGVDRPFVDKRVSDHYPVWAEFYIDQDN